MRPELRVISQTAENLVALLRFYVLDIHPCFISSAETVLLPYRGAISLRHTVPEYSFYLF